MSKSSVAIQGQFKVGDQCHISMYTDVKPCTVVEVNRNGREVVVEEDNGSIDPNWKPDITIGGFAGHCNNQNEQKTVITRAVGGHRLVFTIRKTKFGRKIWAPKGESVNGSLGYNHLSAGWHYFYDYNY